MSKAKSILLHGALVIFGAVFVIATLLVTVQLVTSKQLQHPVAIGSLVVAAYLVTSSVLYGLWQIKKLLALIEARQAFTQRTLPLVRKIRGAITFISFASLLVLPAFYQGAQAEDAPGLMLLGIALVLVPFAVWAFAVIVEELFKSAISLQEDVDYTI